MTPKENTWYISPASDSQAEYRMKVTKLHPAHVDVVDPEGNRRSVNRYLFETTMEEAK